MLTALEAVLDPAAERPCLRADAEIGARVTRWGERDAVVHAAGTPYLRLRGDEVDVVERLDGSVSVGALAADAMAGDGGASIDDVVGLVADLYAGGLLTRPPVDVYQALGERLQARQARRRRWWSALRSQSVSWGGADRFVDAVYRGGGRLLYTWPAVVVSAAVIVGGVAALAASSHGAHGSLVASVSGHSALVVFGFILVAMFCHEMAHALAVKRAGRRVINAGFRLYLGHPAFFVDSTDLVFATPQQRAYNAIAGPWMEATLAGAAAIGVWLAPHVALGAELRRFAAVAYLNVALNLIPFIELDGYWLLSDLLDVPQLRKRSLAIVRHELPARLRGRRSPLRPSERAMALFAVVGLLTSTVAVAFALRLWWPLATSLVAAAWRTGFFGRVGVVLVLAFAAGPLTEPLLALARAVARGAASLVDAARFRAESSWRIEAAGLLKTVPGLVDLDDDTLSDLAGRVTRRRVPAGTAVVRQGDAATSFFLIRRGRFDVTERDTAGEPRVLRRLGDGDSFGELALLDRRARTATVTAAVDSEVFEFDAGSFERVLAPSIAPRDLAPAIGPALEIRELALFRHLSLAEADLLATRAERVNAQPGEAIVTQGDAADAFYAVVAGQLEVARDGAAVATLRAGDHFGETGLLDEHVRTATVRAIAPAQLLRFDAETFRALIAHGFARYRTSTADRSVGGEFG